MANRAGIRVMFLAGVAYVVIGVGFSLLDDSPDPTQVLLWRLGAWIASAAVAVAQIAYEHYRLGSTPRPLALRAAGAVALGALGLAVAANVHAFVAGTPRPVSLLAALVAWPVMTALPAFVAALIAAFALRRVSPRAQHVPEFIPE